MSKHKSQHNPKVSDDRAAASLAFATTLSEQFMPQQEGIGEGIDPETPIEPQEAPQTPEIAPQGEEIAEEGIDTTEEEEPQEDQVSQIGKMIDEKFETFKEEIKELLTGKEETEEKKED